MELLHPLVVFVAAVFGLIATTIMDFAMDRLPEGRMPPAIAAAAVSGNKPEDVERGPVVLAHYGSGTVAGVVYLGVFALLSMIVPDSTTMSLLALAGAGTIMFGLMIGVFFLGPLSHVGGLTAQRVGDIKRSWMISAGVYVITVGICMLLFVQA
ncbi:hypothetical protein K0C01_06500 [Salinarchaeum sp. IM2453]|uniref:hypothetical protein n=1 Tax=Salinarchaeum sp. IM2453 TaxID=2862870 RepID=UPI001C839A0D|nr:hypothetical protein [Salinarchaeum sp. IM2453]QZA87474.1 hypothetical protein K0C01_06500 [Salinarchaeum sp. IM2453]